MPAEYGTLSLEAVLEPAMQMAEGYSIDAQTTPSSLIGSTARCGVDRVTLAKIMVLRGSEV